MTTIAGLQRQIGAIISENRNESPEHLALIALLSECGIALSKQGNTLAFFLDRCSQMEAALTELANEPHGQAAVIDIARRGLKEPTPADIDRCEMPHGCWYRRQVEAMARIIAQADPAVKAIRQWYFDVAKKEANSTHPREGE